MTSYISKDQGNFDSHFMTPLKVDGTDIMSAGVTHSSLNN